MHRIKDGDSMRKFIIAMLIFGAVGYCLFRIIHIVQMEQSPQTDVECGRYYLDNGKQQAYIDILSADASQDTFVISFSGYDFKDTLQGIMNTYGTVTIGEEITKEDGNTVVVKNESECEEFTAIKQARLQQEYDAYLAQNTHTYYLVYEYDPVLGWYQYADSECRNLFDLRYDPKRKLIEFDMYLWHMEEGAV